MPVSSAPGKNYQHYLPLIIVPVYCIISITGIFHHEVWLDEAHHFLLARDSSSLSGMIYACRFEGHPLLWNTLLYFVTRVTHNVMGMQLLHVFINCITVYFICKSPFSTVEKILVIFGYYCLFEYNIISRNYGISLLFIILVIYVYSINKRVLLTMAMLLFLLANTHLFSLLFSGAFALMYVLFNRDIISQSPRKKVITAACILLAGWIIAAWSIVPAQGYASEFIKHEQSGYLSAARVLKTVSVCLKGIFYLPDYSRYNFINTVLYSRLPGYMVFVLSLVVFAVPIVLFKKCRQAVFLFGVFSVLYMAVYYFMPLTFGVRYFGFFYIVFITCYWLAYDNINFKMRRVVTVIFAIQFVNGIYAYTMDVLYPFSESKSVAGFLDKNIHGENVYIISHVPRPGISAYTGQKYFGAENGQQLSYCLWNSFIPRDSLKRLLNFKLVQDTGTSIIIGNQPLGSFLDTQKLVKLQVFDKGIEKGENVTIYRYYPRGYRTSK